MARTKIGSFGGVVLEEDEVGMATKICYKGVSTCVTVTLLSPTNLIGVHLTAYTSNEEIERKLKVMRGLGAYGSNVYIIGPITRFKQYSQSDKFNTRKRMKRLLSNNKWHLRCIIL